ncbi:MAG: rRNA maturation RNase YbeY [Bacteroidetes bacterium]|nr:MAG: rRNA maturation RNase YbeY [Bacteroidota bacterium]
MSSDKIKTESNYPEVGQLLQPTCIEKTHRDLAISKGVIYYFVSDDDLLEINKQSLNHDYYTDIITFDYSDDDDIEDHEIVISWDRVKENAVEYNEPVLRELHRVCIHGLLHIAGYKDDTSQAKQKMRSLENHYLALHCST